MEDKNISPLLEELGTSIEDLQSALTPLLGKTLSDTATNLSALDRAKLYVLLTYTIESILFSFLRLNGVNAQEHPVFRELTRVKQYFEKIKDVENGASKRENLSLNKQAAGRIIKHALAANDREWRQTSSGQGQEAKASIYNASTPSDIELDKYSANDGDGDKDDAQRKRRRSIGDHDVMAAPTNEEKKKKKKQRKTEAEDAHTPESQSGNRNGNIQKPIHTRFQ